MTHQALNALIETSGFEFIAGQLCLDFINTEIVVNGQRVNLLKDYAHLAAWLVLAEQLTLDEAEPVIQTWGNSNEGEQVWARAIAWREMAREMVEAIIHHQAIAAPTIGIINEILRQPTGYMELLQRDNGFVIQVHHPITEPTQLLFPLAHAAADLLTQTDWTLVKRCNNSLCIRYFYDTSKNHSRRWCSMDGCGNRQKVAAYYARQSKT